MNTLIKKVRLIFTAPKASTSERGVVFEGRIQQGETPLPTEPLHDDGPLFI